MSMLFSTVKNFVQSPTELKVKQATDENENFGATATLMNEISVLTYSAKTLKEITQIIRKKLLLGYNKRTINHKNCVMLLKTLTLISYLMNNGSNDFIGWTRSSLDIFTHLNKLSPNMSDKKGDNGMLTQIINTSKDITQLIEDEELLERRRHDVVQFRSSISSPGRKSTDNSHLRSFELGRTSSERYSNTASVGSGNGNGSGITNSNNSPRMAQAINNPLQRASHSLDLRLSQSSTRHTSEYSRTALGPLREEDTADTSALNDLRGLRFTDGSGAEEPGDYVADDGSKQEATTMSGTSFRSRFKNNIPFV